MLQVENLQAFKKALDRYAEETKQIPLRAAKKLILEINRQTITTTPVRTGRLVGGWFVSLSDRPEFGANSFSDDSPAGSQAAAVRTVLDRNEQALSAIRKNGILWLSNNVDYARVNEFGNERQRGKYMLTSAIEIVRARAEMLVKQAADGK